MDNARDCVTKEIVEAEDLKLLAVVDTYGYQCTGCETQAFCSGLLIPDTDLGENPRRERGV
ncbi:hypothetical protein ACIUZH_28260 [Pseudomonas aeruginosa]|uniref:hypothetical protein n=1 Tax=Pseudomonas aeruginosa TaxID=287 RepID=UPI001ADC400A|nr:hypothetical protein [Pseudomonas aeruginosa]